MSKKEVETKLDIDNPEDLKLVAQGFIEENQELLEALTHRLVEYATVG